MVRTEYGEQREVGKCIDYLVGYLSTVVES